MPVAVSNPAVADAEVMSPHVSVVLPTFNRGDMLLRSVTSVLKQTYPNLELIVVDDGSTDHTAAVIGDVKDARLKYVRLARNRGQAAARNIGIAESRGLLIAFQDSDDTWQSDKLEQQVNVLAANPDVAGVYCDLFRIQRTGKPFVIQAPDLVRGALFDRRRSLYQSYAIGIQSCVFRREVLEQRGRFREDMRCFEDLELLLRLSKRHYLRRIASPLVNYYETEGVSWDTKALFDARVLLFRRYGYRAAFVNREAWLKELKFYLLRKAPAPW